MEQWYTVAKAIPGTSNYHHFIPLTNFFLARGVLSNTFFCKTQTLHNNKK